MSAPGIDGERNRPPLWVRLPYYVLGTRVPRRWLPWVESDIARPRWHPWVSRSRLMLAVGVGVVAFAGPWTEFGSTSLVFVLLLIVAGALYVRSGAGDAERRDELLFQRRQIGWDRRIQELVKHLAVAGEAGPQEGPGSPHIDPIHDHEPALRAAVPEGTLMAACDLCEVPLQWSGTAWEHIDPDWTLYECPGCRWQDASEGRCPACERHDLVRTERPTPSVRPRARFAWVAYTVALAGLLVWFLVRDDRLNLMRFFR